MKFFSLMICLLLLGSCHNSPSTSFKTPDYEKKADAVTAQVAKKIKTETGLRLMGTGGGMMENIQMMAMSFGYYGEPTMEEARELLVYCVQEYLSAINNCAEIRSNLAHYPFTPKDVEIRIFIYQQNREAPPVGSLAAASVIREKLVFDISQPYPTILAKIHEETFEEALKIIEKKDPNMDLIKKLKVAQ